MTTKKKDSIFSGNFKESFISSMIVTDLYAVFLANYDYEFIKSIIITLIVCIMLFPLIILCQKGIRKFIDDSFEEFKVLSNLGIIFYVILSLLTYSIFITIANFSIIASLLSTAILIALAINTTYRLQILYHQIKSKYSADKNQSLDNNGAIKEETDIKTFYENENSIVKVISCYKCANKFEEIEEECNKCGAPRPFCIVCRKVLVPEESIIITQCCNVYIHKKHLQEWLNYRKICPSCKKPFLEKKKEISPFLEDIKWYQ